MRKYRRILGVSSKQPAAHHIVTDMGGSSPLPAKGTLYLRTVIVTAAVYRRFSSELRPEGLTPPLNVPAPGRRQCIYMVLRLRMHLCF